jgi:hypothetical protein
MLALIFARDNWFGFAGIAIGVFLAFDWIRDLRFYKSNNWDFSKDCGRNYIGTGFYGAGKANPKMRVLFAFPLIISISMIVGIAILWS